MSPNLNPQQFVAKWRNVTANERKVAQSHFNDVCELIGHENDPRVMGVAKAARELVKERDNWLNPPDMPESELKKRTLTNLYNERPTWLDLAHRKLDAAVLDCYGWPRDLNDDDILGRLLALNLERAKD